MFLRILDSLPANRFSRNLANGYISEWFKSDFRLPQGSLENIGHYFR